MIFLTTNKNGLIFPFGIIQGCHTCQQKMETGKPAVIASKVTGECWHPGCFACFTCRELLVDMIYFSKKGHVYCERHYADILYPRCFACDEVSGKWKECLPLIGLINGCLQKINNVQIVLLYQDCAL